MKGGWRTHGLPRAAQIRFPRLRGRLERINERRGPSLPNPLAAPDEVGSRPDVRLWIVAALFAGLFVFMGVRLAILQIADHAAYVESIQTNSIRETAVPAPRGDILARSGLVLVANHVEQELAFSQDDAAANPGLIGRVAALAHLSPKVVRADLHSKEYLAYQPVPILTNTPTSVIVYLEEHRSEFPGVTVQSTTERAYPPGGEVASQLLGYVGPITSDQYAQVKGTGKYTMNSIVGKSGIEQYYDAYLRGTDGYQEIRVDALGDPLSTLDNVPAKVGDSVVLNLDAPLQNFVTNALAGGILRDRGTKDPVSHVYPKAINGAVVVLDPRNGHVLALASWPTYNLKEWVGGISTPNYRNLLTSQALNNYAIDGQYTPGSTFKMITATAALDDHLIAPDQYVDDTGQFKVPGCLDAKASGCTFRDDEISGLGEVDLPLALTESSDYYFYNVGYLFWSAYKSNPTTYPYGETPIQDVAAAYGLDAPTGIDLPYEAPSIVDSPQVHAREHAAYPHDYPNGGWFTGDNLEMAFGQGGTVLTPLALANAYATFANGGTRYTPEVAAAVVTPTGRVVRRYLPRISAHVDLPASVRNPILQGLVGVVNDPSGTGYGAFHAYANFDLNTFPIAGKTGTASLPGTNTEPNSWFVGFGPVGSPRYVVLCVIAQGGYGADAAAPIVAQTFGYLVHHPVGPLRLPRPTTGTTHGHHHAR